MDVIRLHDLQFKPLVPAELIEQRIKEMAAQMNRELKHERPLFIAILNGAFMFAAELMKHLNIECEITFVKFSSYNGTSSTGKIKTDLALTEEVNGRNVVLLEDVVDSGSTISHLLHQFQNYYPETISIATLLLKPAAWDNDFEIKYIGFKVPDEFLVGFGLDYDGLGRNLPGVFIRY